MDWIEEDKRVSWERWYWTSLDYTIWICGPQKIMKPDLVKMKLSLLGEIRKVTVIVKDSDVVNKPKHISVTSPNLIHSLDVFVVTSRLPKVWWLFSVIHDSVLCRATDTHPLWISKRLTCTCFVENDYLKDWRDQLCVSLDPDIIVDTSWPESVIESTYFFC